MIPGKNMKVDEIIRKILQVIDSVEDQQPDDTPSGYTEQDLDRFKQIAGILPSRSTEISNAPNEEYAGIESVTTDAGGGINAPKHPSDIRGDHISLYPNLQYKPGNE